MIILAEGLGGRLVVGIDVSSFTVLPGKKLVKTENFWFNVRVKRDSRAGDRYFDVLVGRKQSSKPHTHLGINLDQSLRFMKMRSRCLTMRRKVDSRQKGRVSDKTVTIGQPDEGRKSASFHWKVIIDEVTKTITPLFYETTGDEK